MVKIRRVINDKLHDLIKGQHAPTPILQHIPKYLRKHVSRGCLNTVLVKDVVVQDQIHDIYDEMMMMIYSDIGVTSVIPPIWNDVIDVQLSELGEELRRNVPVPVFNALIDVFDMRQMIVDGEQ